MKRLSAAAIKKNLISLPLWQIHKKKLHREFKFKNFADAFAFMTKAARLSETMNHHPEWSNVYNRVTIDLTTHDAGGISEKDFKLAKKIDEL